MKRLRQRESVSYQLYTVNKRAEEEKSCQITGSSGQDYDGGDGVDGSCGEKRDMVKEVDKTDF